MPSSAFLAENGATRFRATLRFNASLLVPLGGDGGRLEGTDRLLEVEGVPLSSDTLARIPVLATLGHADQTSLRIDALSWDVPGVRVHTIDGSFRLRVCREGGDRLFSDSGQVTFGPVHPNPSNAEAVVEFGLPVPGPVSITLVDLLGREVVAVYRGNVSAGRRSVRIDAGVLPSGLYHLVFRGGDVQRVLPLRLVK
jgi:hypothetical protein